MVDEGLTSLARKQTHDASAMSLSYPFSVALPKGIRNGLELRSRCRAAARSPASPRLAARATQRSTRPSRRGGLGAAEDLGASPPVAACTSECCGQCGYFTCRSLALKGLFGGRGHEGTATWDPESEVDTHSHGIKWPSKSTPLIHTHSIIIFLHIYSFIYPHVM